MICSSGQSVAHTKDWKRWRRYIRTSEKKATILRTHIEQLYWQDRQKTIPAMKNGDPIGVVENVIPPFIKGADEMMRSGFGRMLAPTGHEPTLRIDPPLSSIRDRTTGEL